MNRSELKEIIRRIIDRLQKERAKDGNAPQPACLFGDGCDTGPTTDYAVGEES